MPGCQPGAGHSMVCGTITCIGVAVEFGVCHANCHEADCPKARRFVGCSSGRSARLFLEKETGEGLAQYVGRAGSCCRAKGLVICRTWRTNRRPSPVGDRASCRPRIALGSNHRVSGMALKVPTIWGAANGSAWKLRCSGRCAKGQFTRDAYICAS